MSEATPRQQEAAARLLAEDARARELSLDPRRSILLQAPAGSGKTTVLTQRILRLLALVDEPDEILAITFTRKAAAEMRERVLAALRGEGADDSEHGRQLRALAKAARDHARSRGCALEENPARLRIQTIDSLNHWLASRLPLGAHAGGELQVLERSQRLHRIAARRALEDAERSAELQQDVETLFDRLDNDWRRCEALLAQMLEHRSHGLRLILRRDELPLAKVVERSLRNLIAETLDVAARTLGQLAKEALPHALATVRAKAPPGTPLATAWREPPEDIGGESAHLLLWRGVAKFALTDSQTWRKRLSKIEGFPPEDRAAKDRAMAWLQRATETPGALEALTEIGSLPPDTLDPFDAAALEALARLLKFAAQQLELVFREQGRVDYAFVAGAARQALVDQGEPTDLALKLGVDLRHVLVDEFQDTSYEQFQLLELLTAAWEPGDGRTLFCVGDPMQSIYQFRQADVSLFLRAREQGVGTVELEFLRLARNFRSRPTLVEWCNSAFATLFPAHDDPRLGAVRWSASVAARAASAAALVRAHCVDAGDSQLEADHVARLVASIRNRDPAGSIAILVAARPHALPITRALESQGVPVVGVDLVPLATVPVVRDLAALARALTHRADRTAWLALLRAPWCGLTLEQITHLVERGDGLTVWEALHREDRLSRLPAAAQARAMRTRDALRRGLEMEDRLEIGAWIEATWCALGGPAACNSEAELTHAAAFFDALSQRAREPDWVGPQDLDEMLAALYAAPASVPQGAVQIMTMHGAKGLEFDHVILPGLGRRTRSSQEPLLRWVDLPRPDGESDLLLAPHPSTLRSGEDELNAYLKLLQNRREALERVRLLYVAATRARNELHLVGAVDGDSGEPGDRCLLKVLWPIVGAQFAAAAPPDLDSTAATAPAAVATVPPSPDAWLFQRLSDDWRAPAIEAGPAITGLRVANFDANARPEFDWAGETTRHVGTVIHGELERLAGRTSRTREDVVARRRVFRARLAALGVPDADLDGACDRVIEAVVAMLEDERGRWILSPKHREAASELELTGIVDGRLTTAAIDRTFVDENGDRWVIDFKTGVHTGSDLEAFLATELQRYRPQLRRYVALASRLGTQRVRAALYFPLLRELRELDAP